MLYNGCECVVCVCFQEHPPLTEDHVWEQQAVMARLGTSEEATRLRAKMQSSSLMSDMQAFKVCMFTTKTFSTTLCKMMSFVNRHT